MKKEKTIHKVVLTEGKIASSNYDIETAEDIQNPLKDLLGVTIKEMIAVKMTE